MNPTYGIILWIVIGGLAGWLGSKVMGNSARQGPFVDVLVGTAGALVGGFIARALFGDDPSNNGFFTSLGISLIGACLMLGLSQLIFRKK